MELIVYTTRETCFSCELFLGSGFASILDLYREEIFKEFGSKNNNPERAKGVDVSIIFSYFKKLCYK